MAEYNKKLFEEYKDEFLKKETEYDKRAALEHMRKLFAEKLKPAYDVMGFERGNSRDFARIVSARDKSVGLKVTVDIVNERRIIYRFHTDPFPFPELKVRVSPEEFDDCHMSFKLSYLLGEDWSYTTTKHLWRGDDYTEHIIEKK